jgi:DUF2946 family protein
MRRLKRYVPIFMIALMVQILAPIGASWAVASAASDPLAAAEICLSHPSGGSGDEGGQQQTHDAACLICCAFNTGAAAFSTPEPVAWTAPYRPISNIVWRDHAPQPDAARVGSNAKARAPPSNS